MPLPGKPIFRTSAASLYADEVLAVLAYEFSAATHHANERKIKRRLRDKKLGVYDQDQIDTLRQLKDAVQVEVQRGERSRYYLGARGPLAPSGEHYVDVADFDQARMMEDYVAAFPVVPAHSIRSFVGFGVFIYHVL